MALSTAAGAPYGEWLRDEFERGQVEPNPPRIRIWRC